MNLHSIPAAARTGGCPYFPDAEILTDEVLRQLLEDYDETNVIYGSLLEVAWNATYGTIGRWRVGGGGGVDFAIRCYEIYDEELPNYEGDNLPVDWYVDWDHTLPVDAFAP